MEIRFSPGINVIFGENGTGKTNIINSILKILGPVYPGQNSFHKEDFFCQNENNEILIDLYFDNEGREIRIRWDHVGNKKRLIMNSNDYITDKLRDSFCPLHIPPNREIKDLPGSSKWTPIGRIIHEMAKTIEADERVLHDYKTKMQECTDILEGSEDFSLFKDKIIEYASEQLGGRGDHINLKLGLLDHKHILKTLQLFEENGTEQYNLSEGGQGVQSCVTMAALRAFSEVKGGSLFIIADEPEAYLHPLAQKSLCNVFQNIAETGTQIIITTHSPHFVPSKYFGGLIKVWMEKNKTKHKNINIQELNQRKIDRGISASIDGTKARLSKLLTVEIREGLFANTVVLCEGESESLSLEIWAKIANVDFAKKGIAVVPANGKFSLIELAEFYANMNIKVFPIFDSDSATSRDRDRHIQNNRWLQEYCNVDNPEDFPATCVEDSFCVFSPDYERVLRNESACYSEYERDVNSEYGLEPGKQKGIRARYVSLKYLEEQEQLPDIIERLIDAITSFNDS